jgi:hypothetical protein
MGIAQGRSAGCASKPGVASETKRQTRNSTRFPHAGKNYGGSPTVGNNVSAASIKSNKALFGQWLAGVVDGDGTFSISPSNRNNSWQFTFKIAQHGYNRRMLEVIRESLGCGSITDAGSGNLQFRIRDRKLLLSVVVPYFLEYPLHTRKQYQFELFHQALLNPSRCAELKAVWDQFPMPTDEGLNRLPSKAWVIGFTEAEGSFYVVQRHPGEFVHGFGMTQKADSHLLEHIRSILHIVSKVRYKANHGVAQTLMGSTIGPRCGAHDHWALDSTNKRSIDSIADYYHNTMVGMKSVEFLLWSKGIRHASDMAQMQQLQQALRNLRPSRYSANEVIT